MQINRCPECGREPLIYRATPIIRFDHTTISGDTKYVCHCYPCGLRVKSNTRDEAVAKWNEMTEEENK
jgi:hypothetical protein